MKTCNVTVSGLGSLGLSAMCNLMMVTEQELEPATQRLINDTYYEYQVLIEQLDLWHIFEDHLLHAKCLFYQDEAWKPGHTLGSAWRMLFSSLFTVMAFLSVVSNLVCLQVAWQFLKVDRGTSYLLMSLVVSDLTHTLALYVVEFNNLIHDMSWSLSRLSCKLLPFVTSATNLSSSFTLCCIAVGRCHAVVRASKHGPKPPAGNGRVLAVVLALCWMAAAGLSAPSLFVFHVETRFVDPRVKRCATTQIISPNMTKYNFLTVDECYVSDDVLGSEILTKFYLYLLPSFVFLPLFLAVSIVYSYLSFYLWSRIPHSDSGFSSKIRHKYEKVIRLLMGLIFLFFACRCPIAVYGWQVALNDYRMDETTLTVRFFLVALRFLNCLLNPLFYGMLQERFRGNVIAFWLSLKKALTPKSFAKKEPVTQRHWTTDADSFRSKETLQTIFRGHQFIFSSLRSFGTPAVAQPTRTAFAMLKVPMRKKFTRE